MGTDGHQALSSPGFGQDLDTIRLVEELPSSLSSTKSTLPFLCNSCSGVYNRLLFPALDCIFLWQLIWPIRIWMQSLFVYLKECAMGYYFQFIGMRTGSKREYNLHKDTKHLPALCMVGAGGAFWNVWGIHVSHQFVSPFLRFYIRLYLASIIKILWSLQVQVNSLLNRPHLTFVILTIFCCYDTFASV